MIQKAFLFTALATIIGVSTGGATTVFAAAQSGASSGQSKAAAMFDKCDKNDDGSLTANEFKACHHDPANAQKKFNRLDANHDGMVSREEAQVAAHAYKKSSQSGPGGKASAGAGQGGGGMTAPGTGSYQ